MFLLAPWQNIFTMFPRLLLPPCYLHHLHASSSSSVPRVAFDMICFPVRHYYYARCDFSLKHTTLLQQIITSVEPSIVYRMLLLPLAHTLATRGRIKITFLRRLNPFVCVFVSCVVTPCVCVSIATLLHQVAGPLLAGPGGTGVKDFERLSLKQLGLYSEPVALISGQRFRSLGRHQPDWIS